MEISSQLLQRSRQSGFTLGTWTADRILRVLVERQGEFQHGMVAAYVNLDKAFDSAHRVTLGFPATSMYINKNDYFIDGHAAWDCECGEV